MVELDGPYHMFHIKVSYHEGSNLSNLKQQYKKFLVIDVIDILFDNIYFSQVILKL